MAALCGLAARCLGRASGHPSARGIKIATGHPRFARRGGTHPGGAEKPEVASPATGRPRDFAVRFAQSEPVYRGEKF
jgi:hypothetical protein